MIESTNPDFTNTPVSPYRPSFGYSLADTSTSPYVAIITPFYNPGPIFHETARSVFQQSFQQWEWLIINDGSTDPASISILEEYRHKDRRIRVIDHDTNRGLSAARNTGFRAAQTKYVVQLDSDDLLEPTAIEKWCWFLESHPEFAFGKGYSVGFGTQGYLWQKGFHNGRAFLDENLVDATCMIRKAVHQAVGGYDEANRHGLEDWDFWLRCASFGYWGGTCPEYLNWYRRRPNHSDRWTTLDTEQLRAFQTQLCKRYPHLWNGEFPQIPTRWHLPNDTVPDELPCENLLHKDKPRLLMIVPWLTIEGADKFNLDLLQQLIQQGWEITIATTVKRNHSWPSYFARYTPDLFILQHFLRLVDYPRFLRYLIRSRQVDVVLISNSELGYLLLPYLRAHFPDVSFVDFCHREEEDSQNGGYPHMSVQYRESLDLSIVASNHLKEWMVQRAADPQRIAVCYLNADPEERRSHTEQWTTVRHEQMGKKMVALLEQAMELRATHPRPNVSLGLGRACAAQAVEYSRLLQVSEWLWNERQQATEEQQQFWIGELEEIKTWYEEQFANWRQMAFVSRLQQRQAWLKEQLSNWQRLAEDRSGQIWEQKAWINELEKGKAWLEEQWNSWQQVAKERERLIQEQQAWIIELERGKAWLEEQWTNCKRLAEGREQAIGQQSEQIAAFKKELLFLQSTMARWQNNFWVRLGLRLANLKQPGGIQNEKNQEMNQ